MPTTWSRSAEAVVAGAQLWSVMEEFDRRTRVIFESATPTNLQYDVTGWTTDGDTVNRTSVDEVHKLFVEDELKLDFLAMYVTFYVNGHDGRYRLEVRDQPKKLAITFQGLDKTTVLGLFGQLEDALKKSAKTQPEPRDGTYISNQGKVVQFAMTEKPRATAPTAPALAFSYKAPANARTVPDKPGSVGAFIVSHATAFVVALGATVLGAVIIAALNIR